MATAPNREVYGNPWNTNPGWGYQRWGPPPGWNPPWNRPVGMKPAWIVVLVLSFIIWWPVGLAALIYLLWSGRMGCWSHARDAGQRPDGAQRGWSGWGWCGSGGGGGGGNARTEPSASGNRAFDEYRAETLSRLEEEQREFAAYLDRLRVAKDKSEFDQFMTERRQRPTPPAET